MYSKWCCLGNQWRLHGRLFQHSSLSIVEKRSANQQMTSRCTCPNETWYDLSAISRVLHWSNTNVKCGGEETALVCRLNQNTRKNRPHTPPMGRWSLQPCSKFSTPYGAQSATQRIGSFETVMIQTLVGIVSLISFNLVRSRWCSMMFNASLPEADSLLNLLSTSQLGHHAKRRHVVQNLGSGMKSKKPVKVSFAAYPASETNQVIRSKLWGQ
jgi:hypothetical protein